MKGKQTKLEVEAGGSRKHFYIITETVDWRASFVIATFLFSGPFLGGDDGILFEIGSSTNQA